MRVRLLGDSFGRFKYVYIFIAKIWVAEMSSIRFGSDQSRI